MNRRQYLVGVAATLGGAGCVASPRSSQQDETATPQPIYEPWQLASYEFTRPIDWDEDINYDPDELTIPPGPPRITAICPEQRTLKITGGMDLSSTPCESAQLTSMTYDRETLNVGIGVKQFRKPCGDGAVPSPYRLNLTFESALPTEVFIFQTNGVSTSKTTLNVSEHTSDSPATSIRD